MLHYSGDSKLHPSKKVATQEADVWTITYFRSRANYGNAMLIMEIGTRLLWKRSLRPFTWDRGL
jgi:hypothetical protein